MQELESVTLVQPLAVWKDRLNEVKCHKEAGAMCATLEDDFEWIARYKEQPIMELAPIFNYESNQRCIIALCLKESAF